MTKKLSILLLGLGLLLARHASAQSTSFTYQGKLTDGANAATGLYDMTFTLFDAATNGNQIAWSLAGTIPVSNGLFTTSLDFGSAPFNGSARWLQIGVKPNGSVSAYTTLNPRTALSPTPYAIYAQTAGTVASGAIGNSQLAANAVGSANLQSNSITSSKIASGQVVKSVNGLRDDLRLVAGSNVSLATNGNNLTINSTGGGGAFALNGTSAYYSGGYVGIGTATPPYPLFVRANTDRPIGWERYTGGVQYGKTWAWEVDDRGTYVRNATDSTLPLTILNGGNIGIGTLTPITPLDIQSPALGDGQGLHISRPGKASEIYLHVADGDYGYLDLGNNTVLRGGNGRWSTFGGNVGIGTTTPGCALDVNGTMNCNFAQITAADSPTLQFYSPWREAFQLKQEGSSANGAGKFSLIEAANGPRYLLTVNWSGNVGIGTTDPQAKLDVRGETRTCVLTITGGCDLAEPFQMSDNSIPKGAVVAIDDEHPGRLKLSDHAYDTRVAGIVSGANGINPGISLTQQGVLEGGQNVALSGRVYALANGPIKPGDLLTSSTTPGHCMKATDREQAQGAIIGKAMSALKDGKGMVLVLVSLQ